MLVCGSADRGDDGAALCAVAHVLPAPGPNLRQRVEVRRCPQLDAADLIDVADGEACLVLDTVVGVEPGAVVAIPLDELTRARQASRRARRTPCRSSQVLRHRRGHPRQAAARPFVGIGGKWFGFGERFSRAVKGKLPDFAIAIQRSIEELLPVVR